MGFNTATEWDVRTTGSDANGGGFQVGSTGTDRSQSDAAYQAYTDLVIDHTTNTKITSAAHPFDATSVGNIINITAGTGFTVQRVQIVSEAAGVATCDKAVGTIDSTGGTGNLGGSLATVGAATALAVSLNRVHVKAGTYTLTVKISLSTSDAYSMEISGYETSHDDRGTKPLITTATNSTRICDFTGAGTTRGAWHFVNLSLSNTAATKAEGLYNTAAGDRLSVVLEDCLFDGFTKAIEAGAVGSLVLVGCEIKNCTHIALNYSFNDLTMIGNKIHDNPGGGAQAAIVVASTYAFAHLVGNLIVDNYIGILITGNVPKMYLDGNTIANNTSNGLQCASSANWWSFSLLNNIFYGNGGWNATLSSGIRVLVNRQNAYGAGGSGDRQNFLPGLEDVTLTADPFTNAAGGDYSLNNDAGGGVACRNAAFQWGA